MDMSEDMDMDPMGGDDFCMGDGMVMLQGWQTASDSANMCVLWLFEGAALDTKAKYAVAVVGTFFLAFVNEMIRYGRDKLARNEFSFSAGLQQGGGWGKDMTITFAFAVQTFVAYSLMLLVMLYEYVFLIAIILGLAVGHILTLRFNRSNRADRANAIAAGKTPPEVGQASSGTPCCANSTTV